MAKREPRQLDRGRNHRPRMGRHHRAEQAVAQMVAVDVLRHDRLGDRLLAVDAGLAARQLPIPRDCSATASARRSPRRSRRPRAAKSAYRDKIAAMDLAAISNDPELLSFALAGGEAAFGDNCAPCHGRGAQGAVGYPNLRDDSWLWGDGSLAAIHQTILHGIRADDPETHTSQMPAFGRTGFCRSRRSSMSRNTSSRSRARPTTRRRPSAGQRSSAPIAPPVMAPTARAIRSSARQISAMSFGSMPATG